MATEERPTGLKGPAPLPPLPNRDRNREPAGSAAAGAHAEPARPAKTTSTGKILIVDDDPALRKTLSAVLGAEGYAPCSAATGKTAIEEASKRAPAVALIDLNLPDVDGLKLMKEIKQRSSQTECIILTGHASRKTAIAAVNLGAFGYLLKPYEMDQLLMTLARAVEKQRMERERARLIADLEAKNADLERFTYAASHDLRSPLVTIRGFLSELEQDAAAGDRERMNESIRRMACAAERMEWLLAELLEFSRIGRVVNPPEEIALAELAREAAQLIGGRIAQRGIQVDISPDLPVVSGDRPQLFQVMQNLIDNAAKFVGDQPRPRIEVGVRRDADEGDETVCYVRDNGVGIDPNHHQHVFGLFRQLDPRTDGAGVGLALVKQIIETHGGRIWLESEGRGQGSAFCFVLPPGGEV